MTLPLPLTPLQEGASISHRLLAIAFAYQIQNLQCEILHAMGCPIQDYSRLLVEAV